MEDSQCITSCESYYSPWIISTPFCRMVNVRLSAELLLGMLTLVFPICSPKWNKLWAWAAWNTTPRCMGCTLNEFSLGESSWKAFCAHGSLSSPAPGSSAGRAACKSENGCCGIPCHVEDCSLERDQTAHTCSSSSCPQGCHWSFFPFPKKPDLKAAKGWWGRAGKGRFCLCAMFFRLPIHMSLCWSHLQKLLVILTKKFHLFSELICHNDVGISVL